MTTRTPRQAISAIDRQIDANRAALIRRLGFAPQVSAAEWQRAWDRCPDLHQREHELYRQRGQLQRQRDLADDAIYRRQLASERRRKVASLLCPTCGNPIEPSMATCELHAGAAA